MVKSILDSSVANENHTTVAKNCLEVLNNSQYRISIYINLLFKNDVSNPLRLHIVIDSTEGLSFSLLIFVYM